MKIGLFVDKGQELMRLSMKWGGFVDGRGIWEGLSMKTGLFVDKGQKLMGLSMKRGGFVDGRGISEKLSMKIGLFVDKGRELMGLSMKRGGFVDGRDEAGGDWQAKYCAGAKGAAMGFWAKDFCKCGIGCIFTSDQARQ